MNTQQFIAAQYRNAHCLLSARELKKYRIEDAIYIMGNGPSAFSILERLDYQRIRYDLSGTSALVLQQRYARFYWYEPHFLKNGEGFKLTTPESISAYSLGRIMHHEFTHQISDDNVGVVIPNPQFPPNQLGYADVPSHSSILVPPWHFINERSDDVITNGLKEWHKLPNREDMILNFRGSIIRQLSSAFIMGYPKIYIGGLDPSKNGYWYTVQELRDRQMKNTSLVRCSKICESYGICLSQTALVAPTESNLAGPESTYYDFNRSILFTLLMLCKLYPSRKVCLLVSDHIISELCVELNLSNLKNLQLLEQKDASSFIL